MADLSDEKEQPGDADARLRFRPLAPDAESAAGGVAVTWDGRTRVLRGPVADAWRGETQRRPLYPLSDTQTCEDGAGTCAHFVEGDGWTFASIYHHPAVGAACVRGAIRDRWLQLGGERGVLGYPAGAEAPSRTGAATLQRFRDPSSGAHSGAIAALLDGKVAFALHGPVHARWLELGADEALGDPISDVLACPDGVGIFAHFRDGAGVEGSIYQTPETGAHPVRGPVRALWGEMGWEKSALGYPVADETVAADDSRTARFQNGVIEWSEALGARVRE